MPFVHLSAANIRTHYRDKAGFLLSEFRSLVNRRLPLASRQPDALARQNSALDATELADNIFLWVTPARAFMRWQSPYTDADIAQGVNLVRQGATLFGVQFSHEPMNADGSGTLAGLHDGTWVFDNIIAGNLYGAVTPGAGNETWYRAFAARYSPTVVTHKSGGGWGTFFKVLPLAIAGASLFLAPAMAATAGTAAVSTGGAAAAGYASMTDAVITAGLAGEAGITAAAVSAGGAGVAGLSTAAGASLIAGSMPLFSPVTGAVIGTTATVTAPAVAAGVSVGSNSVMDAIDAVRNSDAVQTYNRVSDVVDAAQTVDKAAKARRDAARVAELTAMYQAEAASINADMDLLEQLKAELDALTSKGVAEVANQAPKNAFPLLALGAAVLLFIF